MKDFKSLIELSFNGHIFTLKDKIYKGKPIQEFGETFIEIIDEYGEPIVLASKNFEEVK